MKTLANCTPIEFLAQTNKIKNAAKDWLEKTKIQEIKARLPELNDSMTREEQKKAIRKKAMENFMDILDAVLDQNPEETIKILALICFVDPEDANNHSMSEYIGCIDEILADDNVASFFVFLASLGQKTTSLPAKK